MNKIHQIWNIESALTNKEWKIMTKKKYTITVNHLLDISQFSQTTTIFTLGTKTCVKSNYPKFPMTAKRGSQIWAQDFFYELDNQIC